MSYDLTEVAVFFSIVLALTVTVRATQQLNKGRPRKRRDVYANGTVRRCGTARLRTWLPSLHDPAHRAPTDIDRLNPDRTVQS